jgi:uncharacterized protein (TIGR02284 family)
MALSNDKIIDELNDLIRFDHDAIGAYDEAINAVTETTIKDHLTTFRADHERHVTELGAFVTKLGGKPATKPGVRGVVRKTMTKIAGLAGTELILRAMKSNEEVLNKAYAKEANLEFPPAILDVVQRNLADEQRHLAWVEQALRDRIWEQAASHP